ncbi:hypothetical protein FRC08_008126 [Ceratobasidium sp. 394]|nr:hypothetical protein FRC08_008126 [Ceratobasidium sp. 394]KAG9099323.1 hypothetical protein FS749_001521 [Ceratobasidium sp. UAMH 11750]
MSAESNLKRPIHSPPPGPPARRRRHQKKLSEPLPEQYERLFKRIANHLSRSEYAHPAAEQITAPLKEFQLWLQHSSNKRVISLPFLDALTKIQRHISSYLSPLKMALDIMGNPPSDGTPAWQTWSFYARERYPLMVEFALLLRTVCKLEDKKLQIMRMNTAIDKLEPQIQSLERWNHALKDTKDKAKSALNKLRAEATFLVSTRRVVLNDTISDMEIDELYHLVNSVNVDVDCVVYNLELLNRNHNCDICTINASAYGPDPLPKYRSPADGSGTPQLRGLFRRGAVSLEDVEAHHFRYITGGTTCGMMRAPDSDVPELALFIHFIDYHKATPQHCLRLERLAYLLHLAAQYSTPCHSNGPQNALPVELRGYMGVLGHRQERFKKIPWGLYAVPPRFKGKRIKEWVDFQKDFMPELAAIVNSLFIETTGAELVTKQAVDFVVKFQLPPFGATSIDESTWKDSAGSSFTVSHNNFSNECHLDNDKYRYVFSVYVFVDKATGQLVTDPDRIEKCLRGGYLIWPDLHLALKIVHCSGVVLLFWRGTHERHCTILSKTLDDSVIRYGTSLQVNKRLFNSVQNYYQTLEDLYDWELNGATGECPDFPELPMDLSDLCVLHE